MNRRSSGSIAPCSGVAAVTLRIVGPCAEAVPALRPVLELSAEDWRTWLQEHGQPPMRARQVRRWLLAGGAESFEAMSDLPKALRQELAASFVPLSVEVARHLTAADDTHKLLLRLQDGRLIECVLIQDAGRR